MEPPDPVSIVKSAKTNQPQSVKINIGASGIELQARNLDDRGTTDPKGVDVSAHIVRLDALLLVVLGHLQERSERRMNCRLHENRYGF